MRKASLAIGALMLLATATSAQAVSAHRCDTAFGRQLSAAQMQEAGLTEPLKRFKSGIERARLFYNVKGIFEVSVVSCGMFDEEVLSLKTFNKAPLFGFAEKYRVYVSVHTLKFEQESLERIAITEVCKMHGGASFSFSYDEERLQHLRAQRCMALLVDDAELLRWLDRIIPPELPLRVHIDKQLDDTLTTLDRLIERIR